MRVLFIVFLTAFFCLVLLSAGFSQSKGGRWQFENNGFDTAEWDNEDNSGTLEENAAYSSLPPPQEGQYYLFLDTLFQYACFRVQDSNDLDFTDENIGISAWIYPLELINDVYFLVNKGRQDSNPKTTNYAMRISLTQHLEFLIRDANNQAQPVASSFTIPVNQWTFVAIFYDYATGRVYMWNTPGNTPVDTLVYNQSFFANTDLLTIGGWYQNNTAAPTVKPFKGRIDDVRISGRMQDIIPAITSIKERNKSSVHAGSSGVEVFPNPIQAHQSKVNFRILLPEQNSQDITVKVYNILGQMIFDFNMGAAESPVTVSWNLQNYYGQKVNSGIYFIQIKGDNYQLVKRVLILK
ncbi:MAG: hypothetical protein A2Y94_06315 [Caldithrix sp. RBG_13_44_9]|nr:MAG: hypothetical protein A2Y94_06315 [Caldithrix sp. RBG_13_44_9]